MLVACFYQYRKQFYAIYVLIVNIADNIFIIIFLIFAGQVLGSLVGLIKKPRECFLRSSLAFAASMMLGISFFQLIPESLKITSFRWVLTSFVLGIVLFWIIDKILPHVNPELLKKEEPSIERSIIMLVIGMALHNIPEGLAIGVGFILRPELGIIIALGIAVQDIPENIATIVPLYGLTGKKGKSFLIVTITILFELIGFIFGYYVLGGSSLILLGMSLSLAAGFMTYISVEELIPAAQVKKNLKSGIISFVLGILCVWLIILLA